MLNKYLAKSEGNICLVNHSMCVAKVAERMVKILCNENFQKKHLDAIVTAAKLHDVGKCIMSYQLMFKNQSKNNKNVYHHEVSWAIAKQLNLRDYYGDLSEHILYAIYWHHLRKITLINEKPVFNGDSVSIINKLSGDDINNTFNLIQYLLGHVLDYSSYKEKIDCCVIHNNDVPNLYCEKPLSNAINTIYRCIVVGSDQLVSRKNIDFNRILNGDIEYIDSQINEHKKTYEADYSDFFNNGVISDRLKLQIDILDKCTSASNVIKAPAGFGKTLVGVLWTIRRNRKVIWICPRNVVVKSVYDSVIAELNRLHITDISVEIFMTGEKITSNCTKELEDYDSDIVITNIDNYLNVLSNKSFTRNSFNILYRDVIFDEFHEFVGEELLFGSFVNMMFIRNNFTNTQTLFLSATPANIDFLWESQGLKNNILPERKSHYNPVHNHKYRINICKLSDINTDVDSAVITNSIKNSQYLKRTKGCDILMHSDFMECDKINNYNQLVAEYGKGNKKLSGKKRVVGAIMIQSSLDVSFKKISIIVSSPESTIQCIGRCDRFGHYGDNNIVCTINLIVDVDDKECVKSNSSAVEMLYDKSLNALWINHIKKYFKSEMTLTEIYDSYNLFYELHSKEIKDYQLRKLKASQKLMQMFNPVHYHSAKSDTLTLNTELSLRSSTSQRFVIYPIENSDEFTSPFTEKYTLNRAKDYDEPKNYSVVLSKIMKRLNNQGFNYNLRVKKVESFYEIYAKNSKSPYIALNKKYNSDYGLL